MKRKKLWISYLPAWILLVLMPCAVHAVSLRTGLDSYAWYPDTESQLDFFMGARSALLIILAVWMLAGILDAVLTRRVKADLRKEGKILFFPARRGFCWLAFCCREKRA